MKNPEIVKKIVIVMKEAHITSTEFGFEYEIVLNKRSFSFWNINTKSRKAELGKFKIQVGLSSKEIKLNTTVKMK